MKIRGVVEQYLDVEINNHEALDKIRKGWLKSIGIEEDAYIKNGKWVIDDSRISLTDEIREAGEIEIRIEEAFKVIVEFALVDRLI